MCSSQNVFDRVLGLADDCFRLLSVQAQRRGKAQNVALRHGPPDDPPLGESGGHLRADFPPRIEQRAGLAILDEFDSAQHAFATHISDMRVVADLLFHQFVQIGACRAGVLNEAELVDQLQIGDPGGGPNGMR